MKPQGALELTLVQSVAHGFWRLSRAETIEKNTFAMEAERNENRIECINPQITEALLQAMAFFNNPHTFSLLTLYEQRIHRKLHKDLKILRELQASRPRTQNAAPPEKAMAATESATYSDPPRSNGFVFSNDLQSSDEPAATAKTSPEPADSTAEKPKAA